MARGHQHGHRAQVAISDIRPTHSSHTQTSHTHTHTHKHTHLTHIAPHGSEHSFHVAPRAFFSGGNVWNVRENSGKGDEEIGEKRRRRRGGGHRRLHISSRPQAPLQNGLCGRRRWRGHGQRPLGPALSQTHGGVCNKVLARRPKGRETDR